MRILHISDFHYRLNRNQYEQEKIVDKLVENLKSREKPDLVFFTGDLVNGGTNKVDFNHANDLLLERLKSNLGLKTEQFFLCPGNHDVNREECSEAIIAFFDDKVSNNDDLNKYYIKKGKDYANSLTPIKNFHSFFKANYCHSIISESELCNVQCVDVGGKKIGVVSLNTAWLSSGIREDQNNLLMPTEIVKQAINQIDKCDAKILLLHHPLSDLREYNYIELQDLIHSHFNLMFSGHLHREHISTQYKANNGIYCNSAQATLTFDSTGEIGFSVVNIDLDDLSAVKLERSLYLKGEKKFFDIEPVVIEVPCGEEKYKQNKFRKKITSKYGIELKNANTLLLDYDETNSRNFLELFSPPVLSKNSENEAVAEEKVNLIDYYKIKYEEDNYLILGKDKCGKTSLLKHVQLELLKNYTAIGVIPFYIDYKELETITREFNMVKAIAQYYELNNNDSIKITSDSRLVILLDNFDPQVPIHNNVVEFLAEHKNARFMICSDMVTARIYIEDLDHLEYKRIYFRDLTRKEIRIYTEKKNSVKSNDNEAVLEKITKLCTQLKLPLNYWMISLILLIYKKSNDDYSKNLFGILDLCVDEILNKKQILLNKNRLKFEQYKELCSKIAFYLLKEHKNSIYAAESHQIISFIAECKRNNPRLSGDPKDIFDFLFQASIFKTKGHKYTFRLNGLFEYFLSYYIKEHPEVKDEILANDEIYLSFKNELEIYTGFNNKDKDFVAKVFEKTKSVFEPAFVKYKAAGRLDDLLVQKIGEAIDFGKEVKKLMVKKPLSHIEKDALLDDHDPLLSNSDVHLKEPTKIDDVNFELLEKYIKILAKVFKNSDGIEDLKFINEVFDYILESYCYIGFVLIEELENQAKEENLNKDEEEDEDFIIGEELLQFMSRIIPVLTQAMLHEGIGHTNFKDLILAKIDELNINRKQNQYKLFLLYFLLIDLDVKANKDQIENVFENVSLSALKVATMFKINFYLAFNAFKDAKSENYFRTKLQQSHLRMDSDLDIESLQRDISKRGKVKKLAPKDPEGI
jgi:predicted MPP superfamily phosphohydrolase